VCDTIHSKDTHLFRIMKTSTTTEAPKHRNTCLSAFRFPISHFGTVRRCVALLFCGLSPICYLPSSIFFFSSCADSHSFCDAIHSEDTNLFPIMKNSTTEEPNHADICILYRCFEPGKRNKGISLPHFCLN